MRSSALCARRLQHREGARGQLDGVAAAQFDAFRALLDAIARMAGYVPGLTTTDGVYIDGQRTVAGDMTGPVSARMVLRALNVPNDLEPMQAETRAITTWRACGGRSSRSR